MAEADTAPRPATPYDRIGGKANIAQMVERFYDLMDSDPAYAELRAMHAPDLTPMRGSLTDFLMAWMGGPRDWFEQRPGACMMSAHKSVGVTRETAEQWVSAMRRAAEDTLDDPTFVDAMVDAFQQMSMGMARNAG
jgi:hemoglobin